MDTKNINFVQVLLLIYTLVSTPFVEVQDNLCPKWHPIQVHHPIIQAFIGLLNIMLDPCPDLGYSYRAEIFWNMKAMRAKIMMVKEKDAATKAKNAIVSIDIVHKQA